MFIKDLNSPEYQWLKKSEFYESLDLDEDDEEIDLKICSVNTSNIKIFYEITEFWGVYYYPKELYSLLFKDSIRSSKI